MNTHPYIDDIFERTMYTIDSLLYLEATSPNTTIVKDSLYPRIAEVLSTVQGDREFKILVGKYLNDNHSKLYTAGPQYLIPFTDKQKAEYFKLFKIAPSEVLAYVKDILKSIGSNSKFIYLTQNPILWVFYCCVRYYHLTKNEKGFNTAITIYALAVYPSVYSVTFPYKCNADVMQYTIDHLTNRYTISKAGNIFATLFTSIKSSTEFFIGNKKSTDHNRFVTSTDAEVIQFIQRIHNDQKSLMRYIMNEYMDNYRKGLRVSNNLDSSDVVQNDPSKENNTSIVDSVANKIVLNMITHGLNLTLVSNAKAMCPSISLAECRFYISRIVTSKYDNDMEDFIKAVLFRFMYDDHHDREDINSASFIMWSTKLFRQTNSNNENIAIIKELLTKWATETGIYTKYSREGTRNDYKRCIFFYFIFAIQFYNQ